MTNQTFQNLKQKYEADAKGRKKMCWLTVVIILYFDFYVWFVNNVARRFCANHQA